MVANVKMKRLTLFFIILPFLGHGQSDVKVDLDNITKAIIFKDSTIFLKANIRRDHRIFGYAKPNLNSEKLILISVFTSDVKDNPFNCRFGAYYDTSGMDDMELKYVGLRGDFIEANIVQNDTISMPIYIEKIWLEFDEYN